MPAPTLEGYTSNTVQNTNEITMTKPADVDAGNYLVLLMGSDDNAAVATRWTKPDGWEKPFEVGNANTACKYAMFWRRADETEGTTIDVSHVTNDDLWGFYLRVSAEEKDLIRVAIGFNNETSASSHEIPGLPLAGDCLCIAGMAFDGGDATFSVSGTGWTLEDDVATGAAGTQASGAFAVRTTTTASLSGAATFGTVVSDGSSGKQFAFVEGTRKEWALIVIRQLIEDIGTDASGWDDTAEGTSIRTLLADAVETVGLTRNATLSVKVRNIITKRIGEALVLDGVSGTDFRKLERNATQLEMADAIAAAEAELVLAVAEIRAVGGTE